MTELDLTERPRSRADLPRWYAAVLKDQEASGLSVAGYAEEVGVTAVTLYQWRRRLSSRGLVDQSRGGRAGLIEVTVAKATHRADPDARFIVRLGNGRDIEVPRGFDDAELQRLIPVVESC